MIDTVVFDLGGVLIDWNPRYVYKNLFCTNEAMEYFLGNICTNAWNEEQDAGRTFADATSLLIEEFPQYTFEILAYYGRWREMLKGELTPTVELLKSIKSAGSFRLYALTNWSAESWHVALERFIFLQYFEGILVSGVENMKKPDHKIFQLLIKRYDIIPEKTLFIDDNILNIRSALELGFNAIHFNDMMQNIKEIKGILNI